MSMLPTYKEIIELIKKGSTLEAQEKISLLREEIISLREEKTALIDKIRNLEEQLKIKDQLYWDGTVYWLEKDDSTEKEGPFCQRCYDVTRKLVRLQKEHAMYEGNHWYWHCLECRNNYFPKDYKEPK